MTQTLKGWTLRRRKLLQAVSGATLVLGVAGGAGVTNSPSVTDLAAIQHVVYASQVEEQTPCAPRTQVGNSLSILPQNAVDAMDTHIQSDESKFYTGDMLTGQIELLQRNCNAAVTNTQSLDLAGGIDAMTFEQVNVIGGTATVAATETKWTRSLAKEANGSLRTVDVRARVNLQDTLIKTTDGWRIANEAFHFAPGQGP